jgi:hypothetical protein
MLIPIFLKITAHIPRRRRLLVSIDNEGALHIYPHITWMGNILHPTVRESALELCAIAACVDIVLFRRGGGLLNVML